MALVSKPKGYVEKPEQAGSDRKVIDVFATGAATGKATKLNPEEDAWERTTPPPYGRYNLQLFPGDPLVTQNDNKKGEFESYSISIMCKVVSENDSNDAICFATVTTRIGRGKEISTAAGLLVKLGYKLDPTKEYTDLQIAQFMVKALKKEPTIANNLCDWKLNYEYPQDSGRWVSVCKTYDEFPVDSDGNRVNEVIYTRRDGTRDGGFAKFFVKEWGGKGSKVETTVMAVEEPMAKKPFVAPTKKKAEPAPKVQEPEVEDEVEDEDEELMLES